jgi:hypothetical protein
MADKKPDGKSESAPDAAAAPAKKGGMKFALITVALLAIEGGVLFAVFSLGGPKPADAGGPPPAAVEKPEDNQTVELLVFEDRVSNDASGVTYQYKADIHLKVKKSAEKEVDEAIKAVKNELREEICGIFRTAEPQHFQEPLHDTLRRRLESALRERFENKIFAGEGDHRKPVTIDRVLVVIGSGIRVSR